LNTSVINESAGLFKERISVRPGKPVMAISSGTVMNRSTSSGERPNASVAICTCTFVTSGKASTESLRAAINPNASRIAASTTTTTRCFRALLTIDPTTL